MANSVSNSTAPITAQTGSSASSREAAVQQIKTQIARKKAELGSTTDPQKQAEIRKSLAALQSKLSKLQKSSPKGSSRSASTDDPSKTAGPLAL
jgi:hypothetical protein